MVDDTKPIVSDERQILDDLTSLSDGRAPADDDAETQEALSGPLDGDDARANENIHQGADRTVDRPGQPLVQDGQHQAEPSAALNQRPGANDGGLDLAAAPAALDPTRSTIADPGDDTGRFDVTGLSNAGATEGLDRRTGPDAPVGTGALRPAATPVADAGPDATPDIAANAGTGSDDGDEAGPGDQIGRGGDDTAGGDTGGGDTGGGDTGGGDTGGGDTGGGDTGGGDTGGGDTGGGDTGGGDTGGGDTGGGDTGGGDTGGGDTGGGDTGGGDTGGGDTGGGDTLPPVTEPEPDVHFIVDNNPTWKPTFEGDNTFGIEKSGTYEQWGATITADTDATGDGRTSIGVDTWNKAKSVLAESDAAADLTVDNFVHAEVRLGDGGDSTVTITDAKRGVVETGDGNDVIDIDAKTNNAGWSNTFTVTTGDGDDTATITGDKGLTEVVADMGDGNDAVIIDGQTRSAEVDGGAGNDTLSGGGGNDTLRGGTGHDVIDGGAGVDWVDAGAGDDEGHYRLADRPEDGLNTYDGGEGHDTLRVEVDDPSLTDTTILSELRALREAIRNPEDGAGDGTFTSETLGLRASNWEDISIKDVRGNDVDLDSDGVSLSARDASGDEDTAIPLDITTALVDTDGSETASITIANVPEGARLSAGTANADGTWTLTPEDLDGLTVTPAADSDTDFELQVSVTATELSGHTTEATTAVPVSISAVNDGPVISGLADIIRVTNVKDLSYRHDFSTDSAFPDLTENRRLDPQKVNGVDPDDLTLTHDHDVSITFVSEGAGYHNTLGWYVVEEDGTIGNPQIIYGDATNTVIAEDGTETVTLTPPDGGFEGKTLGFFLVGDGHNKNKNADFWNDASANQNGQLAFVEESPLGDDATLVREDDGSLTWVKTGADGTEERTPATLATTGSTTPKLVFVGDDGSISDVAAQGGIYHSAAVGDTTSLNPDNEQHAISGVTNDGENLLVGFEDLKGLGDHDFNDLVFKVNVGAENARQLVPTAVAPGIEVTDVDSPMLTGAEARLSDGFMPGDELHLHGLDIDDDGFIAGTSIKVEMVTDDQGSTIRFTGEADQDTYTDVLSRVKLQNSGDDPALGDRYIDFSVSDGEATGTSRATVRVTDDPDAEDIVLGEGEGDTPAQDDGAEVTAEGDDPETATDGVEGAVAAADQESEQDQAQAREEDQDEPSAVADDADDEDEDDEEALAANDDDPDGEVDLFMLEERDTSDDGSWVEIAENGGGGASGREPSLDTLDDDGGAEDGGDDRGTADEDPPASSGDSGGADDDTFGSVSAMAM